VPKTLLRRAYTLVTQEDDIKKEEEHIKKTLKMNGYPDWAIRRKKEKVKEKTQDKKKNH